jgi:hypothetical protein
VTGFRRVQAAPLPTSDFGAFKAVCYDASRRLGGLVLLAESCDGKVTPNFHRVGVSFRGKPLEGGILTLAFLEVPELEGPFVEWRVLKPGELYAPILPETLSLLSEAERAQVKSWKAKTVGEVIFNFWD